MKAKKKLALIALVIAAFLFVCSQPVENVDSQPPESRLTTIGNPEPPNFQLGLCVLYKNGTLIKGAVWEDIVWGQVDRVAVRNVHSIGGFESEYGSIVWYLLSHTAGLTYDKPIFFVFQRFWAQVGATWHRNYLTTSEVLKTPYKEGTTNELVIGWSGEIDYASQTFPVSLGLKMNKYEPYGWIKTNVTTPVSLENHAIEYQMYLNPAYSADAERYVKYVRVYFTNGSQRDFSIHQAMDVTNDIPDMVSYFTFLNEAKSVEICTFNFADVFSQGITKFAKIEQVTLPNGVDTYVIKIGVTLGPLEAGETMIIDPDFGHKTAESSQQICTSRITGSLFVAQAAGTIESITVYVSNPSSVYDTAVALAIYRHNDSTSVGATTDEWVEANFEGWKTIEPWVSPTIEADVEYVIVCWGRPKFHDAEAIMYYTDGDDTEQGHYYEEEMESPPTWPSPVSFTHEDRKYSIYATYSYDVTNDALETDDPFIPDSYGWANATVTDEAGIDEITNVDLEVNTTGDAETFTVSYSSLDENYDDHTEVDENGDILVIPSKITVDTMRRDAQSYVYRDMGAGHFSGDFEHWVDMKWTAHSGMDSGYSVWQLSNSIGTTEGIKSAGGDLLAVFLWWQGADLDHKRLLLKEVLDGTNYPSTPQFYIISKNVMYYLIINRSGSSLTCRIYADSARTSLLETLSIDTLQSVEAYRYLYGLANRGVESGAEQCSGYVEYLNIYEKTFKETSDTSDICTLDTSTSTMSVIDSDTIKVCFYFKFSLSATLGLCDVKLTSLDRQDVSDEDLYNSKFSLSNPPTNDYCDLEDADIGSQGCLAKKKAYTFRIKVTDADGGTNINYVQIYLDTGGINIQYRWTESTDTFSEESDPSGYCAISSDSADSSLSGNQWTLDFELTMDWDYPDESLHDVRSYVIDDYSASDDDTYSNVYYIENDLILSSSNFINDDRGDVSQSLTASATLWYYGTTMYPPDAQIIQVQVHDPSHNNEGSGTTTNGYFSIGFTAKSSVTSTTYHIYVNGAGDYPDGDITGQTDAFISDRIEVYYLELHDSRVDGNTIIQVRAKARLDYDNHELGTGDSLTFNCGVGSWDAGNGWFEDEKSGAAPSSFTFSVSSASESTYGVTSLYTGGVSDPTGIWDRIEIYSEALDDSRVNINADIEFRVKARLDWDNHALGSGDSITANFGALSWDAGNSWFDGTRTQGTVGDYTFTVSSGNEVTYGITLVYVGVSNPTGVWDQVTVRSYSASDTRDNINDNVDIDATIEYEYDDTDVTDGSVTINGYSANHQGSGVWRITRTSSSVTSVTYNTVACSGNTYGITSVNQNDQSVTVIWDRVNVTISPDTENPVVGTQVNFTCTAVYEYDNETVTSWSINILRNTTHFASGNFTDTQSVEVTYEYTTENVTENTYSLTVFLSNTATVTWSEPTILSIQATDYEENVLTATIVFMNNGTWYYQTVDSEGWANFTVNPDLENVTVYATWYDITVNASHVVSLESYTHVLNCTAYPFVHSGTRYHVTSDADISSASYASSQLTVQFSSNESTYLMVVTGPRPTYLLNVVYDLSQNYTTYLNVTHYSNTTIVVGYSGWGETYIRSTTQLVTDVTWLGQKLYITSSGSTGQSGQIEIYCGSRGQPVNNEGFTSTEYSSSTTIFSGSYVFSSTKIVWVDWTAAEGGPPGGPPGGMVIPQLVLSFPKLQITEPMFRGSIKNIEITIEFTNPSATILYVTDVTFNDYTVWFLVEEDLPMRILRPSSETGYITITLRLTVPKKAEVGQHQFPCEVVIREGTVDHVARSYITLSVAQATPTIPTVMPIVFLVILGVFFVSTLRWKPWKRKKS